MSREIYWKLFFIFIGVGNFINGLWMLINPNHWYQNLPGRVPDFGPMNEHFVRDLGCVFVLIAILSFKAAKERSWRKFTFFVFQFWFIPHALIHLFDTFRGLVAMEHLYMDLPLVYMPPLLITIVQYIYNQNEVGENLEAI